MTRRACWSVGHTHKRQSRPKKQMTCVTQQGRCLLFMWLPQPGKLALSKLSLNWRAMSGHRLLIAAKKVLHTINYSSASHFHPKGRLLIHVKIKHHSFSLALDAWVLVDSRHCTLVKECKAWVSFHNIPGVFCTVNKKGAGMQAADWQGRMVGGETLLSMWPRTIVWLDTLHLNRHEFL